MVEYYIEPAGNDGNLGTAPGAGNAWLTVEHAHEAGGLAAANLPADIDAILTDTGTTLDGKITTIDTVVDAIKVITDALPNSGALTTIDANIDSILADTGMDGVVLTAAAIDAILDEVVEGTLTLRQAIRLFLSALSGKSSGGGTVTLTFRDNADSKNRITATVDANGNRTAMTLDGT